jgi:hypothetical protein
MIEQAAPHLPRATVWLAVATFVLVFPGRSFSQPPAAGEPAENAPGAGGTDHDSVVGAWGLEARRVASLARTAGQENGCGDPCLVDLNALSLRRWSSPSYAWSLGLALGAGGGSSRQLGVSRSWDTYFGMGPTVGANFLLSSWKHLAVSLAPQLDVLFFLPSGKGSKSFIANLRGLVEGEVHLGMIGLPAASVSLSTGLELSFLMATKDEKPMPVANATGLKWTVGLTGPQSLWDLVTRLHLRYYF